MYLTSFPSTPAGTLSTLADSVGVTYSIFSDSSTNNRFISYSDSTGRYYINNKSDPVYLSKAPVNNLSSDDGGPSSFWGLIYSLQDMLAECQGGLL